MGNIIFGMLRKVKNFINCRKRGQMEVFFTVFIQKISKKQRKYRLNFCMKKLVFLKKSKILDVGCGQDGRSLEVFLKNNHITGIDLFPIEELEINQNNFTYIQINAKDMSLFEDNQFDIAFCIGMLEHICDRDDLEKVCKEIRRVSKQYAIMVPWKYAFIEPHFKLPFFPIYPLKIQKKVISRFNLHGVGRWMKKEGESVFEEHYQWLSSKEWKKLFPESEVYPIFWGLFCDVIAVIGPFK